MRGRSEIKKSKTQGREHNHRWRERCIDSWKIAHGYDFRHHHSSLNGAKLRPGSVKTGNVTTKKERVQEGCQLALTGLQWTLHTAEEEETRTE